MKEQVDNCEDYDDYEERDEHSWPHYYDMIYDHIEDLERLWKDHVNELELIKEWMSLPITKALSMLMEADALMARMGNRIEYIKTTQVAFFFIGRLGEMQQQCKCLRNFIDETSNSLYYKEEEKKGYHFFSRDIPFKRPETLFDGIIPDDFDSERGWYKPMGLDNYTIVIRHITRRAHDLYVTLERLTSYVLEAKESFERSSHEMKIMDHIEEFKITNLYKNKQQELLDQMPQSVKYNSCEPCINWLKQNEWLRRYLETRMDSSSEKKTSSSNADTTSYYKRRNAIVLKVISEGIAEWVDFITCLTLYYEIKNGQYISKELPEALNNTEALSLLKKTQYLGLLDNQWQPTGDYKNNKRKASVLAYVIGQTLNLSPLWASFEILWDRSHMRNDFNGAITTKYYRTLKEEIKKLISN